MLTRGISLLLPILCVFPRIYCFGNFSVAYVNWLSISHKHNGIHTIATYTARKAHMPRFAIAKNGHTAGRRTTIDHLINAIWTAKDTKCTVGSFNLR